MKHPSNPIEDHHDKLFSCQIKAVRDENPNFTDAEVFERAVMLNAKLIEAENKRHWNKLKKE